jgi:hypothetical protein
MAKRHYSADSSALPLPPYSPDLTVTAMPFKALNTVAPFRKDVPVFILATGVNAYIGESGDLNRRLPDHVSVRRKTGQSTSSPSSID